ncbi:MAG: hypothetical protein HZB76_01945 [Chlamydiae bacterium]|nr:hypothetical protein [Chlamydiota bacterium]
MTVGVTGLTESIDLSSFTKVESMDALSAFAGKVVAFVCYNPNFRLGYCYTIGNVHFGYIGKKREYYFNVYNIFIQTYGYVFQMLMNKYSDIQYFGFSDENIERENLWMRKATSEEIDEIRRAILDKKARFCDDAPNSCLQLKTLSCVLI